MKLVIILSCFGILASLGEGLTIPSDGESLSTWRISTRHVLSTNHSSQRCSFHKSPIVGNKQQIVEETHLKSKFVHHIDLFRCSAPKGQSLGQVFDKFLSPEGYTCDQGEIPYEYCQYYEWWSCPYPPPDNRYPDNVAHAIDENEYVMMVIHYENPDLQQNVKVEAGIEFSYSAYTKAYDAAFLQVGRYVSYKNLIPPNSQNFVVPHTCQSDCTRKLPSDINIFGITFHAHSSAKEVKLQHLRKGKQVSVIAHDIHYSPEEPFKFKKLEAEIKFLPGDELQVECTYDTTWAEGEVMIGGNTLQSEMCIAFVEYYPKTLEFSNCGTTAGAAEVNAFFGISELDSEDNIDPVVTSPKKLKGRTFTDVVKSLPWTEEERAKFQDIMINGPRDSYCQPHKL